MPLPPPPPLPDLSPAYPDAPAYFRRALSCRGLSELVNGELNPQIEAWLVNHTRFPPELINPKTAWCAAAVSAWLEQTGQKSTHSAAASSYLTFGKRAPERTTLYGVLVLRRGTTQHHVGLCAGAAGDRVMVLGGNQSGPDGKGTVCIKLYPVESVIECRVVQ